MIIKRLLIPVLIIVLVVAAFWLTGCTSLQLLNATVSHRGYMRTTDISYGKDPRQKLDVYVPQKIAAECKSGSILLWRLMARGQQDGLPLCRLGADFAWIHSGVA